ncbi:Basic helix-loop-helix DNA-binding superfamily protein isoform 2 [Hibiscus syriacus]|uniref:Basic helix-loop-helix DNA-binding superfamily protein isoform 2 n=1 Tax=Hibiscus syriacus TaxID=106335 RepID=A0A6A2YN53_HIBSY|nr:Basic helix-loop-helix DNA-binding superfamily protein isoform 2 [Hibiscus syriacus]
MKAGNPSWWSMHLHPPPPIFPQYVVGSPPLPDNQELPQSWSQLLLGGFTGEEESKRLLNIATCTVSSSCSRCLVSNHGSFFPKPQCNSKGSTGGVWKKARVQPSSSQPPLKTDTASVLLEAIGYIRFLQGQIEALSSPYLGSATPNMRNQQSVQGERSSAFPEDEGQEKQEQNAKDLRSRGLCLVPVSCTHKLEVTTVAITGRRRLRRRLLRIIYLGAKIKVWFDGPWKGITLAVTLLKIIRLIAHDAIAFQSS